METDMTPVSEWTCSDVGRWLGANGFSHYVEPLCLEHKIDGEALLTLSEDDLRQPPLKLNVLGEIKRLMISIRRLQLENKDLIRHIFVSNGEPGHRSKSLYSQSSNESNLSDRVHADLMDGKAMISKKLEPEYFKLLMAYIYGFSVFLVTSFTMVIVNERVPDMEKYPPLPDIVLDNMPYIPWAFEMCEWTGIVMSLVWVMVLIFHKHRFILMRRMFAITGTIFLLRCVTMLITSLSVPGIHLKCEPLRSSDFWTKFNRGLEIWRGMGMSLQGVRTCGDYMFSGHTVFLTMLNFLITEYTPLKFYQLHTATWCMNIFGIFFILAAHEHYSIDVFIAFYITSRLFLYYHSLANNRALMQQDHRRTRIWFPMFSYFESQCDGIVPNVYENPLKRVISIFSKPDLSKEKIN